MYNQPFFMPGFQMTNIPLNMTRVAAPTRNLSLFSKLASPFRGLKNINWGGFINNASKTLGIINQGIPLVKQVGPMMNNMKSMLKVASIFKDETDDQRKIKTNKNTFRKNIKNNSYPNINYPQSTKSNVNYSNNVSQFDEHKSNNYEKEELYYDNSPTFFINT